MKWEIYEHRNIAKICRKLPVQIVRKYELWKNLVFRHGPDILRKFPGFQDEKLEGKRMGQRSSRLSRKYRVFYEVEQEAVMVYVIEITPHRY